jgi:hypothetical protein
LAVDDVELLGCVLRLAEKPMTLNEGGRDEIVGCAAIDHRRGGHAEQREVSQLLSEFDGEY